MVTVSVDDRRLVLGLCRSVLRLLEWLHLLLDWSLYLPLAR